MLHSPPSPRPARPAPDIRRVSPGSGMRWWAESVAWLFTDFPRVSSWVGMALLALLILLPLHWIPLVGSVVAHLLWFVLAGGLMAAARTSAQGMTPPIGTLFSGFGPPAGRLFLVGLLVLLAVGAVLGLLLALGLGTAFGMVLNANSLLDTGALPLADLGLGGWAALAMLACLFLFVPICQAAWLAPALVMLDGIAPLDALHLSLSASARNLGALTVYGLVFVVLATIATMTFVGLLFLLPLATLSSYAAYRDLVAAPDSEALPSRT